MLGSKKKKKREREIIRVICEALHAAEALCEGEELQVLQEDATFAQAALTNVREVSAAR
jgi:hypothetical protein